MSIIEIVLVIVVTSAVLAWIRGEATAPNTHGATARELEFRYGRRFRALAWLVIGFAAPVVWAAFHFGFKEAADPYIFAGILAFFLAGGGWMLLEAIRTRIAIDDAGMDATTGFRKPVRIPWQEVESISYDPIWAWLTIETVAGSRVHISRYLKGVNVLAQALRDRLPHTVRRDALGRLGASDAA